MLSYLGYKCQNIQKGIDYLVSKGYAIREISSISPGDILNTTSCEIFLEGHEKIELITTDDHSMVDGNPLLLDLACYEVNNVPLQYSHYINKGAREILAPHVSLRNNRTIAIVEYKFCKIKLVETFTSHANIIKNTEDGINSLLPASYNQQWFWFLDSVSPSWYYNMPFVFQVTGKLNILAFREALSELVRRHESLRTTFRNQNGTIHRLVLDNYELPFYVTGQKNLSAQEIKEQIDYEAKFQFQLSGNELLFRIHIQFLNEAECLLYITMHHSIFDGWSFDVFFTELSRLYNHYAFFLPYKPPNLVTSFSNYIIWQNNLLSSEEGKSKLQYWKNALSDAPSLQFPTDYSRPSQQTYLGKYTFFKFSDEEIKNLQLLAKSHDTTIFTICLSIFYILLSRYSNQSDFIFGTPFAGRNQPELAGIIGYFTNILPIRINANLSFTYAELIKEIKSYLFELYDYQAIPFGKIVEQLPLKRDLSKNPLFQVLFAYQNIGLSTPNLDGLDITLFRNGYDAARFDFTFEIEDRADVIQGGIYYNVSLFSQQSIDYLIQSYREILSQISVNKHVVLDAIRLLNDNTDAFLINQLNSPITSYEATHKQVFMRDFFETQVNLCPNQIALKSGINQISYYQLNQKANQLVNYLRQIGIKQHERIGIATGRCAELIIAIICCFKGGYVYVPLEVDYPKARLEYIIHDASILTVITTSEYKDIFSDSNVTLVNVTSDNSEISQQSTEQPQVRLNIYEPAYIFYTSGSTGKPKGSLISRFNIVNLIESTRSLFDFSTNDKVILFHSYAFDVSLWEIFSALCYGATLVIPKKEEILSIDLFYQLLSNEKITVLNETPSAFEQLLFYEKDVGNKSLSLRYIILAGEALKPKNIKTWFDIYGTDGCKVINMYGITETTIYSTYLQITPDMLESNRSNIGRGIPGVGLYILDKNLCLLPPNVIGEIYVAGHGVGQGYLNLPELTNNKFLDAPMNLKILSQKIYKTGDLGRYLINDDIEYLGRIDNQVKLRGYRVELEEIESVLLNHIAVNEVLVHLQKDILKENNSILVAFVVPKSDILKDDDLKQELTELLRDKVPEYMRAQIAFLEAFPITINNKIDKNQLPLISYKTSNLNKNMPSSESEKIIAKIWQDILGVEINDIDISFFELGGNSLYAMQLHSKINEIFSTNIKIIDLFNHSNIRKLAKYIDAQDRIRHNTTTLNTAINTNTKLDNNAIAIIGMAGKFPKANDLDEFWKNLINGVDSISRDLDKKSLDSNYIAACGMLDEVDKFDADFFNIAPSDAIITDPQHRVFLEITHEALENAGYSYNKFKGKISIYAGMGDNDYYNKILRNNIDTNHINSISLKIANDKDYLATKIAYKLNLTGPAININTACSTALVAVVKACQGLTNNESDIAIAGGISLILPEDTGYYWEANAIFSRDGVCRGLDKNSSGTVPSSGAGVVVLKRLSDAIKDRDTIHAVISGYALNNDGSNKISFAAPSMSGQKECISNALKMADVHPRDISYIETHGTGTQIGDSMELQTLTDVFNGKTDKEQFCALGTVKNNIGHTQSASGIAGLIKTIFIVKERIIPPHINFNTPNSTIDHDESPFFINTSAKFLKNKKITAGVSSFGIGGTNAHILLNSYEDINEIKNTDDYKLIVLSAKDETTLNNYESTLKSFLESKKENSPPVFYLDDLAYTLQIGRNEYVYRRAWICKNISDAINKLNNSTDILTSNHDFGNTTYTKLYTVAQKWLNGDEIDWQVLHSTQRKKIPLPTYPYNRKRYWFTNANACDSQKESQLIPINVSTPLNSMDKNLRSELFRVIAECLGYDAISDNDNFTTLGGDSLIAINTISRVEKELGYKLPIDTFLKSKTFYQIYTEIISSSKKENNETDTLICLKKGSDKFPPIFIIHPGNGGLYTYENFVQYVTYEGTVWGVQNSIFNRSYKAFNSIEDMAAYYIKLIKDIQPIGPYNLSGWSLGASVAFEMTRQLALKNDRVSNLILIDGWYKYNPKLEDPDFFYNLHMNEFENIDESKRFLLVNLLMTRFKLFMDYIPKLINTPISLIKARTLTEEFNVSDDYNNWKPFTTDKMDVFLTDGDHLSMFSSENIKTLASVYSMILKNSLANAQS